MGGCRRRPGRSWGAGPRKGGGDDGSAAVLSSQLQSRLHCRREAAPARRAEPMLDLEVVPERSLGNEQWEFTLGKCGVLPHYSILWFLLPTGLFPPLVSAPYSPAPKARRPFRPIAFGALGSRYPLQPARPASLSPSWALTPSPQALTGPLPGQWYSSDNNNND